MIREIVNRYSLFCAVAIMRRIPAAIVTITRQVRVGSITEASRPDDAITFTGVEEVSFTAVKTGQESESGDEDEAALNESLPKKRTVAAKTWTVELSEERRPQDDLEEIRQATHDVVMQMRQTWWPGCPEEESKPGGSTWELIAQAVDDAYQQMEGLLNGATYKDQLTRQAQQALQIDSLKRELQLAHDALESKGETSSHVETVVAVPPNPKKGWLMQGTVNSDAAVYHTRVQSDVPNCLASMDSRIEYVMSGMLPEEVARNLCQAEDLLVQRAEIIDANLPSVEKLKDDVAVRDKLIADNVIEARNTQATIEHYKEENEDLKRQLEAAEERLDEKAEARRNQMAGDRRYREQRREREIQEYRDYRDAMATAADSQAKSMARMTKLLEELLRRGTDGPLVPPPPPGKATTPFANELFQQIRSKLKHWKYSAVSSFANRYYPSLHRAENQEMFVARIVERLRNEPAEKLAIILSWMNSCNNDPGTDSKQTTDVTLTRGTLDMGSELLLDMRCMLADLWHYITDEAVETWTERQYADARERYNGIKTRMFAYAYGDPAVTASLVRSDRTFPPTQEAELCQCIKRMAEHATRATLKACIRDVLNKSTKGKPWIVVAGADVEGVRRCFRKAFDEWAVDRTVDELESVHDFFCHRGPEHGE